MKVLKKQLKQGTIHVLIETGDDLWYCYTIIETGDVCTGKSEYKYKIPTTGKVVKKRVWVSLNVDKTEFRQETAHLRIAGTVVDGSEEVPRGSHHSIDVGEGVDLAIKKDRWMDFHLEKINDAVQSAGLRTLIVLFDRENAVFALLRPNGHEILSELKGDMPKKGFDEGKTSSFYKQISQQLVEYMQRHNAHRAVAASPSFWKEYLRKELSEDLVKKVVFAAVSSVDESAIGELLKRPELKQALAGERAAKEEELVSRALEALAKDKLVYGMNDLKKLLAEGNISELIVTEQLIMNSRRENTFHEVEALMRATADLGAGVHIISSRVGEKIDGLGGVVAVKRW